jgi:hypothetical protein
MVGNWYFVVHYVPNLTSLSDDYRMKHSQTLLKMVIFMCSSVKISEFWVARANLVPVLGWRGQNLLKEYMVIQNAEHRTSEFFFSVMGKLVFFGCMENYTCSWWKFCVCSNFSILKNDSKYVVCSQGCTGDIKDSSILWRKKLVILSLICSLKLVNSANKLLEHDTLLAEFFGQKRMNT